jgi:hemerythrin
MALHFEWTEEMSVGESTIDAQHQRLLAQVNKLIDSMVFGTTSAEVTDAISFLEKYIDEHLSYEERYMEKRGFDGIEEHKKQHDNFRKKYVDFKNKLDSGSAPNDTLIEIEEFLGQWWINHIGHEDRKYYLALGAAEQ